MRFVLKKKNAKFTYFVFGGFRFTCNAGHFLDGSPESTCVDDGDNDQEGVWTSPAPVCVIITCPPPHVNPQNGMVSCSDGNIYLSVCE